MKVEEKNLIITLTQEDFLQVWNFSSVKQEQLDFIEKRKKVKTKA